jgi:competence protein ComEC
VSWRRPPDAARLCIAARLAFDRWTIAEHGRFLAWLPVSMGAGVLQYFAAERPASGWLGPALVVISLVAVGAFRFWLVPRALALAGLAAALGFASAALRTERMPAMPDLPRHAAMISGVIRAVEPLPAGRRLVLGEVRIDGAPPLSRRIRIRVRGTDRQALMPGERVSMKALVRPPFAPTYPGGWDLRRDEFYARLAGGGFALSAVRLDGLPDVGGLGQRWQRLREIIGGRILAVLPGTTGAVAATLLTGIATAIPPADRAAFATAGLAHILAVAGLHIGIVMSTVFAASRAALALSRHAALRWPIKEIAAVIAIAAGGGYMALTGMHLPIIRSFAMASLVTVGLVLGRRALSLRGLGLAATLLMLTQPEAVADVSFQMSFAAVVVLIAGYEAIRQRPVALLARGVGFLRWLRRDLLLVATTSLLAAAATAPFVAYHFGQVQPYSVVANLLAVPLTAFWVLPWGLAALALMPLGLAFLALIPMGWGCAVMVSIARLISWLPAATLAVPPETRLSLAIAAFGLVWLCLWRSRLRLLGLVPLLVGSCALPCLVTAPDLLVSPDLRIIAFRTPGAIYLMQAGKDDFTLSEWHRFFGARPLRSFPAQGRSPDGRVICSPDGCLLRGASTALLWRAEDPPATCRGVAILVTTGFLDRLSGPACADTPIIDRATVRRVDAVSVRLTPKGAVLAEDRPSRGDWPWLPPPWRPKTPSDRHWQ